MTEPVSPGTGDRIEPTSGPGMPRWVKVMLIAALVMVAAIVITRMIGMEHGPGLHGP